MSKDSKEGGKNTRLAGETTSRREVASSNTWQWLRRGEQTKETDYCSTNVMKARIDKSDVSPMCRMCNAAEETVFHIVSEFRVHAQTESAKVIHWDLCKKNGVNVQSKWYDHVPEKEGRRNGPCQDSQGLQYTDRSCYRT